MKIPQSHELFRSSDTGAGHNIVVPPSVAEAYYSQVPGVILDDHVGGNVTLWYVFLLQSELWLHFFGVPVYALQKYPNPI